MRSAPLLALAFAAAACGGREPPFRWREGSAATLEIRVHEQLVATPVWREVQVALEGRAGPGGALALEVVRVRHERCGADGRASVVETWDVGASAQRTAEEASVARVAESLVHRSVQLTFDERDGLRSVSGMDSALAAAAAAGDSGAEEARDGLRSLLSDAALLRALRAAGIVAPPDDLRPRAGAAERRAGVFVPGRGLAEMRLVGDVGAEKDGSHVLRLDGSLREDAEFSGPAGAEPPPEVGPVRLAHVEGEAETLLDRDTSMPLRGRFTLRVPFATGAAVATRTSFTFSVRP